MLLHQQYAIISVIIKYFIELHVDRTYL